ncbi:MAG: amidohydrolase [Methanosarcinales archaeon]|nr:amidohydrolase [Methanosarcinales archaeon]
MSLLLKDTENYGNVYIDGGIIAEVGCAAYEADIVIDASNKALVPGFVNTHTHAAMTLFRGYADDLPLRTWLQDYIWPLEAKLTEEDVYWGTKLACLEMIRSGTTAFNDMYWHALASARAVEDMGIRAAISNVFIDVAGESDERDDETVQKENRKLTEKLRSDYSDRIIPALGPHAIYTVSEESLLWTAEFAREKEGDMLIHIHVSETEQEVNDCIERTGMRPVEYLDHIGFLGPNVVAAHCVWLDDREIALLARHDVKVAHNPVSNMKLAVGMAMRYPELRAAGVCISLGTDGCASNNNLDMLETAKFASLAQKAAANEPTMLPAEESLALITKNGADVLRTGGGSIAEGSAADLLLIDLLLPEMTPFHNLDSNLVYSAHGGCVDTTICNGVVLMQNRVVPGEAEILRRASEVTYDLVNRE